MISRERVRLALDHKEPDRVPIDIGAMRSTGISAIAYNRLLKKLGIEQKCRMYDFQQQLAYTDESIRDRFRVDVVDVGQAFVKDITWKSWSLNDGSECLIPSYLNIEQDAQGNVILKNAEGFAVGKKPRSSLYTEQCYWPYGEEEFIPDILDDKVMERNMWSIPCPPVHLNIQGRDHDAFVKTVKQMRAKTDCAMMISIGQSFFEFGQFIRGVENFLMDIYLDRSGVVRLLDKLLDQYMEKLSAILADVAEDVDIIQFGDDLGTQNGLWMNPEVIKELFVPRYKKLWDYVHTHSNSKIFMHSCGSIYQILPALIDAGLDIINPVQTSAAGMDATRLKTEFGSHLTFWGGGCDTQGVLANCTPEQVKDDVKRRLEIFMKGGGYVFNQIHNILADVPAENIVAMYDAAYEFGVY